MCIAKTSKTSKKSKKKQVAHLTAPVVVDHTHLCFGYYHGIVAALSLVPYLRSTKSDSSSGQPKTDERGGACNSEAGETGGESPRFDLLVVGLGGGALPMFLSKCALNVSLYHRVSCYKYNTLEHATPTFSDYLIH